MKEEYIKAINSLMAKSEDMGLLDLVYQLLSKSERSEAA